MNGTIAAVKIYNCVLSAEQVAALSNINLEQTKPQPPTITIDVNAMDEEAPALVKVRLPATVIDSLAIDENNQMDVAALLSSFESLPNGDLVTVDAPDAKVRVWIE